MTIKLEQVLDAIETADDAFTYFYDTQTGETVFLSDPLITGESYEELEELIESSGDRFLRFPTKYDIHEYTLWKISYIPCPLARRVRNLSTRSAAGARSGGSKTASAITG